MTARTVSKHLRLLPVVMLVAAGLFVVKGADLVEVARAQSVSATQAASDATQAPAKAGTDSAAQDAASDPAAEDGGESSAEVDVLSSLAKRRAELDARAKTLDMRANLLSATEKRVDSKITDLKSLQDQIQTLLGKRDDAEKAQITALVKVYSAMKPRDAARIFNALDETVLLDVAHEMKPDSLAAIMAAMNPDQAQALTVKLANRLKLPARPDLPSTPEVAAASPAPAAPSPAAAPPTSPAAAQPGG